MPSGAVRALTATRQIKDEAVRAMLQAALASGDVAITSSYAQFEPGKFHSLPRKVGWEWLEGPAGRGRRPGKHGKK